MYTCTHIYVHVCMIVCIKVTFTTFKITRLSMVEQNLGLQMIDIILKIQNTGGKEKNEKSQRTSCISSTSRVIDSTIMPKEPIFDKKSHFAKVFFHSYAMDRSQDHLQQSVV